MRVCGVPPFIWSVTFHIWFVGVAMALVWRLWPGHETEAKPALLEPSDGGERGAFVSSKPMKKSNSPAVENLAKKLHARVPSVISVTAKIKPLAGVDPVSRPYVPGGGWNGGVGKSFLRGNGGNGYGPGSGVGICANFRGSESRKPKLPAPAPGRESTVLVLDVSGSMRAHRGAEANPPALREFIRCVQELPADASFNVICFARAALRFREGSLPATSQNRAAAVAWACAQFRQPHSRDTGPVPEDTGGGSRFDLGLIAALRDAPRTVLLISDGQPVVRAGGRSLPQSAILAHIGNALLDYNTRPAIHTIATRPEGSGFLQKLAAECGGEYHNAAAKLIFKPRWLRNVQQRAATVWAGDWQG